MENGALKISKGLLVLGGMEAIKFVMAGLGKYKEKKPNKEIIFVVRIAIKIFLHAVINWMFITLSLLNLLQIQKMHIN
jgi:hypothetical protein